MEGDRRKRGQLPLVRLDDGTRHHPLRWWAMFFAFYFSTATVLDDVCQLAGWPVWSRTHRYVFAIVLAVTAVAYRWRGTRASEDAPV